MTGNPIHRHDAPNQTAATISLCESARAIDGRSLPSEVIEVATRLLLDGTAVMLAGSRHPTIKVLADCARDIGARPRSPIYGHGFATSPAEAAFVLGAATHVLDFEPMFDPPTHVVSPVLPALLSLAADTPVPDGPRFLAAFCAGIQLQADLRRAALATDTQAAAGTRHFPFQALGFHPPGPVGALGSALACGLWLGLDTEQLAMALGIAASRASGIAGNIGTMTKCSHCGHAARAGLESAVLASKGFTASTATLEGPSGWGEVFGGAFFDHSTLLSGMKTLRAFTDPGFANKRWPAHTAMQVTIATALRLHRPDYVPRSVHIKAPALNYCSRPMPVDSDAARFSFQYAAAVSLLDGEVSFDSFTEERLADPVLRELLDNTRIELCPSIPVRFTQMWVEITVDGKHKVVGDRWPGHWKSPMSDENLNAKLKSCTDGILPANEVDTLAVGLRSLTVPGQLTQVLAQLERAAGVSANSGPSRCAM